MVDQRQRFRAYRTRMHFFRDDPSLVTVVRWFTVPKTRPFLGRVSQFMSRRWERDLPQTPLGEELTAFELCRDFEPPGLSGAGVCGTAEQWLHGCLTTDPLPPLDPASGVPVCCGRPVQVGAGGEAEGAGAGGFVVPCGTTWPPIMYGAVYQLDMPFVYQAGLVFYWDGTAWRCVTDWNGRTDGSSLTWSVTPDPVNVLTLTWSVFSHVVEPDALSCAPVEADFRLVVGAPSPNDDILRFTALQVWRPTVAGDGGETEGGRGWPLFPILARGTGGEAEGGSAGPPPPFQSGIGGEAEGGDGLAVRPAQGIGGEAEGGTGSSQPTTGIGGEAEGGTGTP